MYQKFPRFIRGCRRRVDRASKVATAAVALAGLVSTGGAQTTDFTFTQYGTYYTIPGGTARVWLPGAGVPVRGLVVFDNYVNKDPTAVTAYRNAATAMGFGLLTTPKQFDGLSAAKTQETIDGLLASAATATGRSELNNVAIAPMGFSGAGNDAQQVAQRYPSRTVGYVAHRIEGVAEGDRLSGWTHVPGLYLVGAVDTNQRPNEVFATVIKAPSNYGLGTALRERGGRQAMVVLPDRGHSDDSLETPVSSGYELSFYWLAKSAEKRFVPGAFASTTPNTPLALRSFTAGEGWYAPTDEYTAATSGNDTPGGTSPFKPIAPIASYTGDATKASWLMDADTAFVFRAVASNDLRAGRNQPKQTPLIFSVTSPLQSFMQGGLANLAIDPRDFTSSGTITRMEFYDGATPLGTDVLGTDGWGINVPLTSAGVRGLNVIAFRDDGQMRAGFRAVSVTAVPEPGLLGLAALAGAALLRRRRHQ